MARLLQVSRSGYYAWTVRVPSRAEVREGAYRAESLLPAR